MQRFGAVAARGAVRAPAWALRLVLPLAGAGALLHTFPYWTTVAGLRLRVQGSLFARPGLSADTTIGSWEFPHFTGLPVGVHVSPQDVDLLQLARTANEDPTGYAARLREQAIDHLPAAAAWLLGETLLGVLLGMATAAGINLAVAHLRGLPRREHELRVRVRQLAAGLAVVAVVAGFGAATYDRSWTTRSRVTGTVASAQLVPGQLRDYYQSRGKIFDVLSAVIGIQAALQQRLDAARTPDTALRVMYISDVHLAAVYPVLTRYARDFGVDLVVNTGDESAFGSTAELTPQYRSALAGLTAVAPMVWVAGNHDSPEVETALRAQPRVTVLGRKTRERDGTIAVTGSAVNAYGLSLAGIPDPRVYGGIGVYGSAVDAETDVLERKAAESALADVPPASYFDVLASHEPALVKRAAELLDGRVRQTNAGHVHAQNAADDLQRGQRITLVEGSSGAGGLDVFGRANRPPIEFSIESVTADCQFAKVVRFQLVDPDLTGDSLDVKVSTVYFRAQRVAPGRRCGTDVGLGIPQPLATAIGAPPPAS